MATLEEKYALWKTFRERWPVSAIESMSYPDYSSKGSLDTFCYWVEFGTKELGSISGSSAFKFGVYSRANFGNESAQAKYSYSDSDAWLTSYGNSAEEAFEHVRKLILEVINHAQSGNLEAIEDNKLSRMLKWKIAFLYQDVDHAKIVNIFTDGPLQLFLDVKYSSMSKLNRKLFAETNETNVFALGELILSHAEKNKKLLSETGELLPPSKNIILYGPPGTGKTHALLNGTVNGLGFLNELPEEQMRTVTFHPSYGYEDFVEGISPILTNEQEESSQLQYILRDGVFKEIAHKAELDTIRCKANFKTNIDVSEANVWKMSLGNTATDEGTTIFEYCIKNNVALLGFINQDLTSYASKASSLVKHLKDLDVKQTVISMVRQFICTMKTDDLIFVTKGNLGGIRAIGQISGDYNYMPDSPYCHARPVHWIWVNNDEPIPVEKLFKKNVSQRTIYSLNGRLEHDELQKLFVAESAEDSAHPKNFVLKIDEINRGNVAKIFGELITIIEDNKRGYSIQLASGDTFSVPENLYLIGTMNTADRSLMHLDTALRRRFHFIEMMPNPELLDNKNIDGINLTHLLTQINRRIEVLLDREHTIGHGYFMQNDEPISTTEELQHVIMNKVLPQLQEYFFDDYAQIQLILGETIIEEVKFNDLPKKLPNRKSYRIKHLEGTDLIAALKAEYDSNSPSLEEQASVAS